MGSYRPGVSEKLKRLRKLARSVPEKGAGGWRINIACLHKPVPLSLRSPAIIPVPPIPPNIK